MLLFLIIIACVSVFFIPLSSTRPHGSTRCDGNCDSCPPHYGYRHGRWYYGHGHRHSCQRGGNGGYTGRTLRD